LGSHPFYGGDLIQGVWGFPKEKIPGPAGAPGQGFCRECGYTPYACCF